MITKVKKSRKGTQVTEFSHQGARVSLYATRNRIFRPDQVTGQKKLVSDTPQFAVVYWDGNKRTVKKFADEDKARGEAENACILLANRQGKVLELTDLDRAEYLKASERLARLPDALTLASAVDAYASVIEKLMALGAKPELGLCVSEYIAARRALPADVTLQDAVSAYVKRHPIGLPKKTVREVADEFIESKRKAGRGHEYLRDLESRLGRFSRDFQVPIAVINGTQLNDWLLGLGLSGRSQLNFRRIVSTFFKFAVRRGYLPRDWDEMAAVEKPEDDSGEIEVFTPDELRKLFAACYTLVPERGVERDRIDMVPYLAIGAFAGLRAAEIKRLDWSEVHLVGPEKYIEIKASKAKTASRRIVPIVDNLADWLAPFAKPSGPVVAFERVDKQLFQYLAPTAEVPWKRNGLRHSFISYRLAVIKDVGQVALEAGNSATMVFKHYRQLTTETQAKEWFAITPIKDQCGAQIIPIPAAATPAAAGTESSVSAPQATAQG